MADKKLWWKDAVIYQIYPRSFNDSNNDGIGDIQGIIQKLDYLNYLGISAIWLCPIYDSPNRDNGYDIKNYEAVLEEFGTMDDLDQLLIESSKRGIRIIMDLVVNHTSNQHKWFIEASKSKNNPYRDYYVWRDGFGKEPPNDLQSIFSGSAWRFNEESGQYYLHLFTDEQPDLNWESQALRQEIYQMMNFWLKKGISGFRLDVIDLIGKKPDEKITANGPELHNYIQEMYRETFANYPDIMTVGETWGATPEIGKLFSDPKRKELSMIFQFEHMMIDQVDKKDSSGKWDIIPLSVSDLKKVIAKWQTSLGEEGWNSLFWNNHDLPRIVSRWGNDTQYWERSAKLFAILLHFLKGTPYVYQGEEIGMTNIAVSSIDEVDDIEARNMYFDRIEKGYDPSELIEAINIKGRDNARTPMQWNQSENAGFTKGRPWFPVNINHTKINVQSQIEDPNSILNTYKKVIEYRKGNDLVVSGDFELLSTQDNIFAYIRNNKKETLLVVANISETDEKFYLNQHHLIDKAIVSNFDVVLEEDNFIIIPPYGAFAGQVQS